MFAVSCDDVGEVFGGSVDACKGVQTESRKVALYVRGEGGPVSSLVVCECAFGWGGVWAVKCVFDEEGKVVRGKLVKSLPGAPEGEVGGGKGDVGRSWLGGYVVGLAGGFVGVVENSEVLKLLREGVASRVCGLCAKPGGIVGVEVTQDVTVL